MVALAQKSKSIIKLTTYDGDGSWLDYKSHFNICATINDWTDPEKVFYPFRVQTQGMLGNLPLNARQYFDELA